MAEVVNPLKPLQGCPGVYSTGRTLFTLNAAKGHQVYGEPIMVVGDEEYRAWDPTRSKLAAMILLGARNFGLDQSTKVLYLGAASGTTASHVSDIVTNGFAYCVEISQRSFRDLVKVCETRKNMIPIMDDANKPENYAHMVEGAEFVYQDIAQRNQVDIFVRNMFAFEAEHGILMIKSRSIDVSKDPKKIFSDVERKLESHNLDVRNIIDLDEYSKDHAAFIVEV